MSEIALTFVFFATSLLLVWRQRIDLFLVAYLSNLIYGWQTLSGKIWVPPYEFEVTDNSELILTIVFLSIALFSILNDLIFSRWFNVRDIELNNSIGSKSSRTDYQKLLAYFLSTISLLLSILLILQAGTDLAFLDKTTLNAQYPLSSSFFLSVPAGIACVYGAYKKEKALIFLGLFPIILYVVIGFRSIAIVLIVAVLLIYSYQTRIVSRKSIRIAGVTALIFISFVAYKQAYIPIKEGKFDFFQTTVSEDYRFESTLEFLLWASFSSEFGQVSSNLELSTRNDLSAYHSYSAVFLSSIPLLSPTEVGVSTNPRFSDTIIEHANPGFSYGLGGTFWGENFVLGGFLGVIIASISFGFTVLLLHYLIFKKGLFILLYLATNLVFLLPKMDIYAVLGVFKNGIVLIALPMFLIILLLGLRKVAYSKA
tara:strand:- start:1121 stop:2398 length:1278 start_codon:yes stop_codon:yes gene_type:complete